VWRALNLPQAKGIRHREREKQPGNWSVSQTLPLRINGSRAPSLWVLVVVGSQLDGARLLGPSRRDQKAAHQKIMHAIVSAAASASNAPMPVQKTVCAYWISARRGIDGATARPAGRSMVWSVRLGRPARDSLFRQMDTKRLGEFSGIARDLAFPLPPALNEGCRAA